MITAAGEENSDNSDAEREIERDQRMAVKGNSGDESDDWEDVDVDDGEMEAIEEVDGEEASSE